MPKHLTSIAVVIIAVWMILAANGNVSSGVTTIFAIVAGVFALMDVLEYKGGRVRRL
jgi:hypothetical protein